ncbi:MAG: HAMP domain-containing sensor histidine kinase [Acidobacteriota bacterium]
MAFIRRHIIGLGLAVVVLALLVNLVVQYRSLAKLGEALPAARRAAIGKRLAVVEEEIQSFYQASARRALDLPKSVFAQELVAVDGEFAEYDALVKQHFQSKAKTGVKRYFVLTVSKSSGKRILSMYDPKTEAMLEGYPAAEGWAAFVAGAPWMTLMWRNVAALKNPSIVMPKVPEISPDTLLFADNDPENPIILKPVTDESSQLMGVAGLVIDKQFLRESFLPELIKRAMNDHFAGEEFSDLTLAVYDDLGAIVTSTQQVKESRAEMKIPFGLVFPRWHIGARSQGMTTEQVGRRYLLTNLSLTLLMTGIIIGGIVFALRAASREMKLSQMKTDFVSNVSHELRTPLSSIRVFGELQRLGHVKDPVRVRDYGEFIETESRRLTQLINNILDFSRIESGQKSYHCTEADMTEVVLETLKTFSVRLQQGSFKLRVESSETPLPRALIDPEAIGQVIVNLLDNAVKYSGTSREITVRLGQKFDHLTIAVSDHGIGIPAGEREKIFERFHRVGTGLVHDVKGSGLGLSLVKHIVEAHSGRVSVTSELGKGSTFTVFIPVCAPQPTSKEEPLRSGTVIVASAEKPG